MSISFLFNGDFEKFREFSNVFFDKNATLKHPEMEMEMLMLAGFVYNFINEDQTSYHFYKKGLDQAIQVGNEFYKAVCLSNIGVLNSKTTIDDYFNRLEDEQLMFEQNPGKVAMMDLDVVLNSQNDLENKNEEQNFYENMNEEDDPIAEEEYY